MNLFTIPEMILKTCNKYSDTRQAIFYKENGKYTSINYSDIKDKVESLALALLDLGLHQRDRIGIIGENRLEWLITDFAIQLIGGVVVPVFSTLSSKQEEYIYSDCEASAIFVTNNFHLQKVLEFKDNVPSLRHIFVMNDDFSTSELCVKSFSKLLETGNDLKSNTDKDKFFEDYIKKIELEDISALIYTSGTTGNPKGVMLTHRNLSTNMIDSCERVKFNENDMFLSYLPWCHSYERMVIYSAFYSGSQIAIAESIETVASNINEIKPTLVTTVPRLLEIVKKKITQGMEKETLVKQNIFKWALKVGEEYITQKFQGKTSIMLKTQYEIADKLVFSKIRAKLGGRGFRFVAGGAALSTDVWKFFQAAGFEVHSGYGLTEASPVVSVTENSNFEFGTVGRPFTHIELKIASDGEILIKGPSIMAGYWQDKEATRAAIDDDGWLYTGDVGELTSKGNLKITDRKKYIIVTSSGKNIAPQPIEELICRSPYIDQCFLLGDNREFCTALITPDYEAIKKLADTFGLEYKSENDLINNEKIIKTIRNEIDYLQKDLAKYERIRKFTLLPRPFSIENGELTPKLSVRRHIVERNYSYLIEEMYNVS
jgi:long-chain acyl-CoA synthetase